MRFAALTWYQIGVVPYKAGTAKAVGDYYAARGRMRAGVLPEGTLAFYDYGSLGHVGTSVGNGQVVSTDGLDNARRPIRQHGYNSIGLRYRGWADPR